MTFTGVIELDYYVMLNTNLDDINKLCQTNQTS